jgi:hypothetical protein
LKTTQSLLLLLALCGCKKENPPPAPLPSGENPCITNKRPVSVDVRKTDFKPGTYWVLYDSIAGTYDSLLIKENLHSYAEYPHAKGQACSWADRIQHTLLQYQYASSGTPSLVTGQYLYFLSEEKAITLNGTITNFPYPGPMIYYDFDTEPRSYFPVTRLDSIFVLNRYVKRVIKSIGPIRYKSANSSAEVSDHSIYHHYFNADIGFLKAISYDSNQVMLSNKVLVRYSILK